MARYEWAGSWEPTARQRLRVLHAASLWRGWPFCLSGEVQGPAPRPIQGPGRTREPRAPEFWGAVEAWGGGSGGLADRDAQADWCLAWHPSESTRPAPQSP